MPTQQSIVNRGTVVRLLVLVCAFVLAIAFIGSGFASAGAHGDGKGSFGLAQAASVTVPEVAPAAVEAEKQVDGSATEFSESFVLETTAKRDITANVSALENRLEAERIAAEEEARRHEAECMERNIARQAEAAAQGYPNVYDVDFTIGKQAFVETWGQRIDAYLEGFPLAGYGATFAEAAWENGIDPRWSVAISNTESTRGSNCFRGYNAWGWMGNGWSSWVEAINAHAAGLSEGYGYTISLANARKYCPPTYQDWYQRTINEMVNI